MTTSGGAIGRGILHELSGIPFPVTMLLVTLGLGLASGLTSTDLFRIFDEGFGMSLGGIALILIPSFVLAGVLSQVGQAPTTGRIAVGVAPLAGAAMVCPDTAYAALAPVSAGRKLSVLFGAYAGFKLLVPAGPAIIATALGGLTTTLVAWGTVAFAVCWAVGLLYARLYESRAATPPPSLRTRLPPAVTVPLAILILLIAAGAVARSIEIRLPPAADVLLGPKGALVVAAVASLGFVDAAGRAKAFDSGVRRAASLILTIGAASALGTMLVHVLAFDRIAEVLVATGFVLPALFLLTASFKLAKGSSMATFAGTSGIVAALLPSLGVSPEAAALAMCAGAFVTIAPNDSLYWLVRQDAASVVEDGRRITQILAVGAALQGFAAFAVVAFAAWIGAI